ncbi:MAG: hypothetical protein ACRELG_27515, partial [Gemmataceae bacterium]
TAPSVNLTERIHPVKARAFEWIVTRQCSCRVSSGIPEELGGMTPGQSLHIIPDVQLHVNRPEGGVLVRHFSEFLDRHKDLVELGVCGNVRNTMTLAGFDPGVEPILREMCDGSLLLVFGFLPPLMAESDPSNAQRFNIDTFGDALEKAACLPVIWDDREVFVIKRPEASTLERIRQFLANFWRKPDKPWWKLW